MFRVLLADYPWSYDDEGTGGTQISSASSKYPVLQLPELFALPVTSVMQANWIGFLWITTPMKFEVGPRLLRALGLRYATTVYWHKTPGLGMGHWFRGNMEELIVGVSGDVPAFSCQLPNVIQHPARWTQPNGEPSEHSQKPDVFHDLIEKATGEASSRRNLELFARREKPGWRTMGGDLSGLDIRAEIRQEAERMHGSAQADTRRSGNGRSAGLAVGAGLGDGGAIGVV